MSDSKLPTTVSDSNIDKKYSRRAVPCW